MWTLRQTCINQVLERKRGGEVKSGEGGEGGRREV